MPKKPKRNKLSKRRSEYKRKYKEWQMKQIEDVTLSNQDADVPYRWTEALCSGLAAKLAVKKRPELLTVLAPLADKAFENASTDERERASLRINPA